MSGALILSIRDLHVAAFGGEILTGVSVPALRLAIMEGMESP